MSGPAKRQERATYSDVCALPDGVRGEIIGGVLHTQPQPAGPHVHVTSALGITLGSRFQMGDGGPGGWWIYYEPELHLDDAELIMVPDVAGWHRARMPSPPTDQRFTVVPDWVCEVSSPSTMRYDRMTKMPAYFRAGVGHMWLVDPVGQLIDAFVASDAGWVLVGTFGGDQQEAVIPPFDAVPLNLEGLWMPTPE